MSVGPRYGGTAQLGVVGRLCWGGGNRWPARLEVDVEVVLACAPKGTGHRDVARGTAPARSVEGMLRAPRRLGTRGGQAAMPTCRKKHQEVELG